MLRLTALGQNACPAKYPLHVFNSAVRSLENKGFIKGAYEEGGGVIDVMITQNGWQYLSENPNLRNPVDWAMIAMLIAAFSALVSLIALFIACIHRM